MFLHTRYIQKPEVKKRRKPRKKLEEMTEAERDLEMRRNKRKADKRKKAAQKKIREEQRAAQALTITVRPQSARPRIFHTCSSSAF